MSTVINNNVTQTIPFFTSTGINNTISYTSVASGYTGIPFTFFIPQSAFTSSRLATAPVWSFSDGTFVQGLTSQKVFHLPGSYTVTLITHTSAGKVALSPVSQNINIRNYVDDMLLLGASALSLTGVGIKAGQISLPIELTRINSWQSYASLSGQYYISLECSNSRSAELDSVDFFKDKWSHIYPSWRFYDNLTTLLPIKSLSTTNDEIWVFYDGLSTFRTTEEGEYSINSIDQVPYFVGSSGIGTTYFVDDTPSSSVNLFFKNDSRILTDIEVLRNQVIPKFELPLYNTGPLVLPIPITSNTPTKIFFTAYGLSSIPYDDQYYGNCYNTLFIGFGDSDGYQVKAFNSVYVSVNGNGFTPTLTSIYDPNNAIDFNFTSLGNNTYKSSLSSLFACKLKINNTLTSQSGSITFSVTGVSGGSNFVFTGSGINIFTSPSGDGRFSLRKIGEEVSLTDAVKSYRLQPNLLKMEVLFDTVLGSLLGNENSKTGTFGKVVYEKIENFVANNVDIQTSNVGPLYSLLSSVNHYPKNYDLQFTGDLQRVVDILSIKPSRLRGGLQHNTDFYQNISDNFGGLNLGNEINFYTDYITAGTDIIVNQFFSNKFFKVPVFCQPLTGLLTPPPLSGFYSGQSTLLSTFPLSCYNESTFGWGIPGNIQEITSNYRFYKLIPILIPSSTYTYNINPALSYPFNTFTLDTVDMDVLSGFSKKLLLKQIFKHNVLNWEDPNMSFLYNNVSSVSSWWNDGMYVNSLIDFNLKKGLGLLS